MIMGSVDNDILQSTIAKLQAEVNVIGRRRNKLDACIRVAQKIVLVDLSIATPQEPRKTKKILPQDLSLGKMITVKRREEIYDEIIGVSEELLGSVPTGGGDVSLS